MKPKTLNTPPAICVRSGEKLRACQEGRVPEIWLIDPNAKSFEAYRRTGGKYSITQLRKGAYTTPALRGLKLKTDWHWQRPLPSLADC